MNFRLRPFKTTDVKCLVKYANNWNVAKFLTDKFPHPYTTKDAKAFILFATNDNPIHMFAIEVNGEAAGGIGIHPQTDIHCKNAELGYWLAEPYWGNGIVTKAIIEMVRFGFTTYEIDRIFARPFGNNKASQRVLQKVGFIMEGVFKNTIYKNGEYLDELFFAIRRKEWELMNVKKKMLESTFL